MLEFSTGPTRVAGISWTELNMHYRPGAAGERDWRLAIRGLNAGDGLPELEVLMRCPAVRFGEYGPECDSARMVLAPDGMEPFEIDDLRIRSGPDRGGELVWDSPAGRIKFAWQMPADGPAVNLKLEDLDLGLVLPSLWGEWGLDWLGGRMSADFSFQNGTVRGAARWSDGEFDGLSGLVAAEGLELAVEMEADLAADGAGARLRLRQEAGELLFGPVYLPPPPEPLKLAVDLRQLPGIGDPDRIEIPSFSMIDPGSLAAAGSVELVRVDDAWSLEALALDDLDIRLSSFWARWMDGPAAAAGFGGLELAGSLSGQGHWRSGHLPAGELRLDGGSVRDPRERFALSALQARMGGDGSAVSGELGWEGASLLGLPLGASELAVHVDEIGLRLLTPFRVPVLDGAVAVDSLVQPA